MCSFTNDQKLDIIRQVLQVKKIVDEELTDKFQFNNISPTNHESILNPNTQLENYIFRYKNKTSKKEKYKSKQILIKSKNKSLISSKHNS